jgi:hypothetical protein
MPAAAVMPAVMSTPTPASMAAAHTAHVAIWLHCGAAVCILTREYNAAKADESKSHDCYDLLFQGTAPPDQN